MSNSFTKNVNCLDILTVAVWVAEEAVCALVASPRAVVGGARALAVQPAVAVVAQRSGRVTITS